jgi:hypothetical protein
VLQFDDKKVTFRVLSHPNADDSGSGSAEFNENLAAKASQNFSERPARTGQGHRQRHRGAAKR